MAPNWLQQHPSKYLDKLIHSSKERIKSILQGGRAEDESNQDSVDEAAIRHISCYEGYTPKHPMQGMGYDTTRLQGIIDRNKHKGSAYCMKIIRLATYAAHKWRERVFLKKNKVCGHPYKCLCKIKLLQDRKIDRPFLENPIRKPMIIDNKMERHSA